jgi:hypothetical protein
MQRTNPTFKQIKLSEEEANAFLDEMFSNLFDSDDLSENTDKIPDLGRFKP